MDPSSLIFLAIIAIWAAYLVGQWVRRRDQLATARSIDRFSEAMRVLERRTPTRPVSAARPTARSYVVVPVRVPPAGGSRPASATAFAGSSRTSTPTPVSFPLPTLASRSGATASVDASVRQPRSRVTPEAARRRARLVLGLVVATVLAWTLVAVTSLVWWPAAVVTVTLAALLVQLRRTARPNRRRPVPTRLGRRPAAASPVRRAAGRPAGRSSSRRRRGLASRVPAPARRARHHEDARSVLDKVDAARRSQVGSVATPPVTGPVVTDAEPDVEQVEATEAPAAAATTTDTDGWQPVPVPPPTYTLKPKARSVVRRPAQPTSAGDEASTVTAAGSDDRAASSGSQRDDVRPVKREREAAAPAFDLDEILERRIASGG